MEKHLAYVQLLKSFLKGSTSIEEEKELLLGFDKPETKKEMDVFLESQWKETSKEKLPIEKQEAIFRGLRKQMNLESRKPNRPNHFYLIRKVMSYAAIALLCIGIGMGGSFLFRSQEGTNSFVFVVTTERGQRAQITLPDGTEVWLNSFTKLSYDGDYGAKERLVSLSGEAYFKVAKDKEHRFVVNTGNIEVEALGTEFNVKAYEDEPANVATLFEGSVRVVADAKATLLKPNQAAVYDKERSLLSVDKMENAKYSCMWRQDELAFSGESMEDIANTLHRMYDVKVCFLSEKVKKYRFSGVIKNNSLDNVFEIISLAAPITYESIGDTIYINEK